ncbi:MAG: sigma-70 family RNA polymerase sigma factor [Clostridium sp.]|uniref:sigma-70 family RNA polymerase sigma factor n=1 Tax=Clostridium sp. TaxID=1506 RepID=UPI00305BE35D
MQEKVLLENLIEDPQFTMKIIMNEYMGLIYSIVKSKISEISSIEDIEECVSDVFYSFYEQRGKIDLEKGSIKAYLCIIAKRKAIDLFRKKVREQDNVSIDDEHMRNTVSDGNLVEDTFLNKVNRKMVLEEINALGEPDHKILVRKYYIGESSKEISTILNMTVAAIDTRASRALVNIRRKLGSV